MKHISIPDIDYEILYRKIFSTENLEEKKRYTIEKLIDLSTINREYIFTRYKHYLAKAPYLENISASGGISKEFQDILAFLYNYDPVFEGAKKEIRTSFIDQYGAICPFCMMAPPYHLDHYLSKAEFPEYTLFPPNLIPCCSRCNTKKGKRYLDEKGKREFFHFYFDAIPEKPVLLFDYNYIPGSIKICFKVDNTITGEEYDLFRRQFVRLDLVKHMNKQLHKQITVIFKKLHSAYKFKGRDYCFQQAEIEFEVCECEYGVNYYETAVYRSILENKSKFETVIKDDDLFS